MSSYALTNSANANIMARFLETMAPGDEVTAADLERLTGVPLVNGWGTSALKTAQKALETGGLVFKVVSGKLVRLSDEDKVSEAVRLETVAARYIRRGARVAATVDDFAALTPESQMRHQGVVMKSVLVEAMTKHSSTMHLSNMVKAAGGIPSVGVKGLLQIMASQVS